MKVIDDGIIKYDRTNFSLCPPLDQAEYATLEYWRKKLYNINLIGEYPESHIGFGNISMIRDYSKIYKTNRPQFLITGTQTGKNSDLDGRHYVRILDFSLEGLQVQMQGPIEASSEVLTHAAIYKQNALIKAVFHVHSPAIWKLMIDKNLSYVDENIAYGTLEMARATQKCIANSSAGIFCMRGHQDGIISYGKTLEEAWNYLFNLYESTI